MKNEIPVTVKKGEHPGAGAKIKLPNRLGDVLLEAGVVDAPGIERALKVQQSGGGRLGSILVSLGLCTEEQIREALKQQLNIEVVNLKELTPDPQLFTLLSAELVRKHQVIPLRFEGNRLWIAMVDYHNLYAIDDIRFHTGVARVVVATCTEGDYRRFVEQHLECQGVVDEILAGERFYNKAIRELQEPENAEDAAEERLPTEQLYNLRLAKITSPIITLCNYLLVEAIRRRASDIHIEPYEESLRVRMRVDGCLHVILTPPKKLHSAIVARFKVLSGLDITKRRIPQDGHLSVEFSGEPTHFRVSTLPTIFGEKCVIRLLQKNPELISLDRIGFELDDLLHFKRALSMPQGLILVTGPTGSGKTTTLHAGLHQISNNEINIVTLEDPVEMTINGINHVPIHRIGGVSFADGLRAILRQDPDVIFVGEMRDPEVGAIAMRAAQTGHLVLSTLHTNSAVESIVRLLDLDIPHYLVASSLLMVISQRLVRRVCELCAVPTELSSEERTLLNLCQPLPPGSAPRVGLGCPACLGTGYRGRLAVFEMLDVNAEVHGLLRQRAQPDELWAAARRGGARSILEAGAVKVLRGETTAAEVVRVLMARGG